MSLIRLCVSPANPPFSSRLSTMNRDEQYDVQHRRTSLAVLLTFTLVAVGFAMLVALAG